jgi:serine protease Do
MFAARLFPAFAAFLCAMTVAAVRADLSTTIERVRPSIVMVGTHNMTSNPQFTLHGTGFAVAGGRVVTNVHVLTAARAVPEGSTLMVRALAPGRDGTLRTATLLVSDPVHDLAVLKIDGTPLPALSISRSDAVREGAAVAFTGFPIGGALGFSPVTHRGIVSAITSIAPPSQNAQGLNEKLIRAIKAGPFQIFQLDATAYPGNSGGPLYDPATGEVLGVINMVFVKGSKESALSQPSGISYAIPAKFLLPMLEGGDLAPAPDGRRSDR